MSVQTIATRLARIQGDIQGVVSAFDLDKIPNKLTSADLPAFVNVPGEATAQWRADDLWAETRLWYMVLYIKPLSRPYEIAYRMAAVRPFFARVRDAFVARKTLESLRYLEDSTYLGDGGNVMPLVFAGTEYSGIEFRLQTVELTNVTPCDTS
jgi:hypothetical protein